MRKLMLSLAVMAALSPVSGYSLGLGDLELNSALNQELNAEIKVLSATTEDAGQIIVKLASREAFSRAGLDRPFVLQQLQFKLIDKNGAPYVKIFTKAPIQEPFLSFLVEIDWPQGHLLREYTLLLDPPVFEDSEASAAPSSSSSNASSTPNKRVDPQAQTQSATVQSQTAQPTPIASDADQQAASQAPAQVKNTATAEAATSNYRVESNDTLWVIADKMRQDNTISVEQMMLALVRKNPNAFIRKNINGVKRGYILRTPTHEEATYFDREQAIAKAQEHSALWRKYRQNKMMANDTPASSMAVDEAEAAAPEQVKEEARLSIVSAGASDNGQTGAERDPNAELARLKQDLAVANEQIESERLEKENLRERLADLEARVKRVIELKDGNLAELQQNLQGGAQTDTPSALPETPKPGDSTSEQQTAENVEATPDEAIEKPADVETSAIEKAPEVEDVFVDETVADEPLENEAPAVDESTTPPAFAQKKNKNIFEQLMDDPKLMGVIVGALAFIFILIALLLKRMRGGKSNDEWSSVEEDAPLDLADIEDAISQDDDDITVRRDEVDMESTIETSADMLSDSEGDEKTRLRMPEGEEDDEDKTVLRVDGDDSKEESDDILKEANVYLAYGIYQQAEELLNNAITEHPERHDYRVKLLETYFASKDTEKFEQLAQQLKADKDNDMVDWERIVAMGMDLCPDNALFSDADDDTIITDFNEDEGDEAASDEAAAAELDEQEESKPDFDLGLDDLGLGDLSETSDGTQGASEDEDLFAEELDLTDDLNELDNESLAEDESNEDEAGTEAVSELGDLDSAEDIDIGVDTDVEAGELDLSDDMDDDFSLDFDASDLGLEESEDETAGDVLDEIGEIDLSEDLLEESAENADQNQETDESHEEAFDVGELDLGGDNLDDETVLDIQDGAAEAADLNDEIKDDEVPEAADLSDEVKDDEAAELETDEQDDLENMFTDSMIIEAESVSEVVSVIETEGVAKEANDDFDISELSEEVDAVGTKLSLAKAYIDMGDVDGARSILEEVKQEGSEEQQEKAEELLQQAG